MKSRNINIEVNSKYLWSVKWMNETGNKQKLKQQTKTEIKKYKI